MAYELPTEIKQLVEERIATGKYASENDVLLRALHALKDYDEGVADIQEGMDDESAGRLRPLREADSQIRQEFGFAK